MTATNYTYQALPNDTVWYGTGDPGDTTETGVGISSQPGALFYNGVDWLFVDVKVGVLQVGIDTNGVFIAGAGAVMLDAGGVSIVEGTGDFNSLKWVDGTDGLLLGRIYTKKSGTAPHRYGGMSLFAVDETPGDGLGGISLSVDGNFKLVTDAAKITQYVTQRPNTDNSVDIGSSTMFYRALYSYMAALKETSAPAAPSSGEVDIYADVSHEVHAFTSLGQNDLQHRGDRVGYLLFTSPSGQTTIYSRLIKGGAMGAAGATGGFRVTGRIVLTTNAASTRTLAPLEFNFGGTTLFSYTTGGTGGVSGHYELIDFAITITNVGADNTQTATLLIHGLDAGASGTTPENVNVLTAKVKTALALNTANDNTFSIYGTVNNSATCTLERMWVEMNGPMRV